jgi:hypothetical protein
VSRGLEKLEKSLNLLKNYNQGLESPRVSSFTKGCKHYITDMKDKGAL